MRNWRAAKMTVRDKHTMWMPKLLAETGWFAIQAKPHREELAAASLEKLDLDVFLPRVRREQRLIGQPHRRITPLFRGYLFARFCPVISLEAVRYARGVLRVLSNGDGPIPVAPEIISEIQGRLQADGFIRLEIKACRPGALVTIEQGPLAGWIGHVERESDDGRRVTILVEAIHKARLQVEKHWLSVATESNA